MNDILDDKMFDNFDPSKLDVKVEPRFLNRELVITISAQDDEPFNLITAAADILKNTYDAEMQALRHSKP